MNDRVKVLPTHYGTGLQNRLGTVMRTAPGGLVEVEMDHHYLVLNDLVAFKPEDLTETKKCRKKVRLASS